MLRDSGMGGSPTLFVTCEDRIGCGRDRYGGGLYPVAAVRRDPLSNAARGRVPSDVEDQGLGTPLSDPPPRTMWDIV